MPGISVLFWNVKWQPLRERVARLVATHSIDVVILAECVMSSATVSRALNDATGGTFSVVPGSGSELRLFSRFPATSWQRLQRDQFEAWIAFRVAVSSLPELLVYAVHLPSKLWSKEQDHGLTASHLSADVQLLEQQEGHSRTVLVGDLNANPFENSIAGAGGLHAVMAMSVAQRETREIRGREYPMLYNPMWGVLGDRTPGPPGTYYRASSESVNYFWNTYDQVLVRPALVPHLIGVQVLDSDGTDSLLTASGLPDATNGSDHLPLLFRLEW